MVFYLYFDPELISYAEKKGDLARQLLIGILRGFLSNCLLMDFTDWRTYTSINEEIDKLQDQWGRKQIGILFSALIKRNRFVFIFTSDYPPKKSDLNYIAEQSKENMLDLILSPTSPPKSISESASLETYHKTNFEISRSEYSNNGISLSDDQMDENSLLKLAFAKTLRHSVQIEICDYTFGKHYRDDHDYSLKKFFLMLKDFHDGRENCKIVIHCEHPGNQNRADYIESQIKEFKKLYINSFELELCFYGSSDSSSCLPHERYIITDQLALNIGRGMDFINKGSKMNRNTSYNYQNKEEISKIISGYAGKKLSSKSL